MTITIIRHGIDCDKAPHVGDGHLHAADDDRPYDVDGLLYCGRCHAWLSSPPVLSLRESLERIPPLGETKK